MFRTKLSLVFIALILLFVAFQTVSAQQPEIYFDIGDTSVVYGVRNASLKVSLSNFEDTVAGIQFAVVIDRPDLMKFDFSGTGLDIGGTLIEHWEWMEAVDTLGDGTLYKFRGIANGNPWDGINTPGIAPQQGGTLVKLPLLVNTEIDSTVSHTALFSTVGLVEMSTPAGFLIGIWVDTLVDTSYAQCSLWMDDSCWQWIEVDPDSSAFDTIFYDSFTVGYNDPEIFLIDGGSLTITPTQTTNCDLTGDAIVDISDLTALVSFLFGQNPSFSGLYTDCDFNGDSAMDITDLTSLVRFLFLEGPPPPGTR